MKYADHMPSVIVVGAGIIGAAVADALAQRGAEVAVLEMRSTGSGASHASAGILAPYTEADEQAPLLPLGIRSLSLYDEFISGIAGRSGRTIEYARSGTLEVALDVEDEARLKVSRDWLDRVGVRAEWLDPAELRSCEPAVTDRALGGLFIRDHGFVGVPSLVTALASSARLSGATFESPVEVVEIVPRPSGVELRAGDRRFSADYAVVAAGSWSRRVRVAGVPAFPVRPVRGQLLHLRWNGDGRPSRIVWGPRCYTVSWSDGAMLVGATVEDAGFDESVTAAGLQALTSAVAELLPDAARATLLDARAGLRPALPDHLPAIGPLSSAPRVVMATGHYRNGILLAPLTARIVAEYVLTGSTDPAVAVTTPDRLKRL